MQKINDLTPGGSATLFPHSSAAAEDLELILELFDDLSIGLPWGLEPPRSQGPDLLSRLHYVRPPQELQPAQDIQPLLTECREWMRTDPHGGYQAFISAYQAREADETPGWAIRQALRGRAPEPATPGTESLHWHLLLHISALIEESRREADALLNQARQQGPLLEGVLEEAAPPDPFLSPSSDRRDLRYLSPQQTRLTVDAWLKLFGTVLLQPGSRLLTLNPDVPELTLELGEKHGLALEKVDDSGFAADKHPVRITTWQPAGAARADLQLQEPLLAALTTCRLSLLEF